MVQIILCTIIIFQVREIVWIIISAIGIVQNIGALLHLLALGAIELDGLQGLLMRAVGRGEDGHNAQGVLGIELEVVEVQGHIQLYLLAVLLQLVVIDADGIEVGALLGMQ